MPESTELAKVKETTEEEIMYVINPSSGFVEAINLFTGETLRQMPANLFDIKHIDGEIIVTPKDPEQKVPSYTRYDERIMQIICDRLASEINVGITDICTGEKGYPSMTQFKRWLQAHPKAYEMYDLALQIRGDRHADSAMKEIRNLDPKMSKRSEIDARKLKIETHLKMAALDNRDRYSEKKQIDHKHSGEVVQKIVLDTGIRRKGDPGYIIDETEKIRDLKEVKKIAPLEGEESSESTVSEGSLTRD